MYQPYDPFAYQAYNDPKPDHYASAAVPAGMPQPSRPAAFQPPAEQPYAAPYQGYGAPPSYHPANPSSHEDQYAPHPSLKQTTSYPPAAPSYPPSYPPKQEKPKQEERHGYQSVPKRDEKKDKSLGV